MKNPEVKEEILIFEALNVKKIAKVFLDVYWFEDVATFKKEESFLSILVIIDTKTKNKRVAVLNVITIIISPNFIETDNGEIEGRVKSVAKVFQGISRFNFSEPSTVVSDRKAFEGRITSGIRNFKEP